MSWLPGYGHQQLIQHLERVLEEYQPRFVLMAGICAGDGQQVQLGDLVVAERVFTYDNGKFSRDQQARAVHEHVVTTYQPNAYLLQFLRLFDAWESLVEGLERPPSPSHQLSRSQVRCHIKPMASGSAVRTDRPFEDVRVPVRGTVAIDMESAALGLVMSDHPLIPWLVVKGVCDYADSQKTIPIMTLLLAPLRFTHSVLYRTTSPRRGYHGISLLENRPNLRIFLHATTISQAVKSSSRNFMKRSIRNRVLFWPMPLAGWEGLVRHR